MSLNAHHKMMLMYEIEAGRRMIASLRTVPENRRGNPEFTKARGIAGHIQMARRIWLSRLGAVAKPDTSSMFPDWPVERIEADAADLDRLWGNFLETLREDDLAKRTHYSSLDGKEFSSTIHEIVSHVHNHSTYHRGQIAMLVTACGGERASTDLIAITRK